MNDFLIQLKEIAITAASGALVTLICIGWKFLKSFVIAKLDQVRSDTNNQKVKTLVDLIEKIADDVSASFDPVAEKMKALNEDGKLSKEDIAQLQDDSKEAVLNCLDGIFSESTLDSMGIDESTIDELIARAIEASLQRRKAAKLSA